MKIWPVSCLHKYENRAFLAVSDELEYQKLVKALSIFDVWCRLVSTTDINLSDSRVQKICCKEAHSTARDCCQTALLGSALEEIGGFGSSALVHVMIMHLGPFIWKHKMIGALAEEGIESVHSKLAIEMQRHKRSAKEKIRNALKWLAIDVLMCDNDRFVLKAKL